MKVAKTGRSERRQTPSAEPNQRALVNLLPWLVFALVVTCWAVFATVLYQATHFSNAGTTNTQSANMTEDIQATSDVPRLPETESAPAQNANLLVVGDIMLGRYVETLIKKNGSDYPFALLGDTLENRDVVLANLEGPIDTSHTQTPDDSLIFSFVPDVAPLLKQQGFSALSIANNHGTDQGAQGIRDTQKALADTGLSVLGHPQRVAVDDVVTQTINGETIVLFGFNAVSSTFPVQTATNLIRTARTSNADAFILVFPHWGNEYQATSSARQRTLAHDFIDAGADAVLGHHPHVVQEAEVYRDRLIVYSLGNFIFDQYFSEETQQGLAVGIAVGPSNVTYTLLPFTSRLSQPKPLMGDEATRWLAIYAERSGENRLVPGTLELARAKTVE